MTNPVFVDCPKGEWTKVATNVTTGQLHKWGVERLEYLITYRLTGGPEPTNKAEGTQIFLGHVIDEPISAIVNSDVYLYVVLGDGRVRVDLNDDPVGKHIIFTNPETGDSVSTIPTNGYTGIVALAPGHVSIVNSTSTPLIADEKFTGEWEDITNFGVIVVSLSADESSATDGLMVQFSADGTEAGIISDDEFTYTANAKKTFSFQTATKYFRVAYTNGGSPQNSFIIQTILKPYYVKPSSHRIQDLIIDDDDAELIKATLTGEDVGSGDFVNVGTKVGQVGNNLLVSVDQVEETTNSLKVIDYSHAELHSGDHFAVRSFELLAKAGVKEFLIITPDTARWAHMTIAIETATNVIVAQLFEGATYSDIGTLDGAFNRNRNSIKSNTTLVYEDPAILTTGTLLPQSSLGTGKNAPGTGARDQEEMLLKQNTVYLFRVTEGNVGATIINWVFDWYEHTNH